MSRRGKDLPKRYLVKLRCRVCGHEWDREFIGTLFGSEGVIAKSEYLACPDCGARRNHPDSSKNVQPELVSFKESEDFIVYGNISPAD